MHHDHISNIRLITQNSCAKCRRTPWLLRVILLYSYNLLYHPIYHDELIIHFRNPHKKKHTATNINLGFTNRFSTIRKSFLSQHARNRMLKQRHWLGHAQRLDHRTNDKKSLNILTRGLLKMGPESPNQTWFMFRDETRLTTIMTIHSWRVPNFQKHIDVG